jgi:hypothetical protein
MRKDGIERPLGRERTNVDFINDVIIKGESSPVRIAPAKCPRVHNLGRSVNTGRLKGRGWVGSVLLSVEAINVACSGLHPCHETRVITAEPLLQWKQSITAAIRDLHRRRC